MEPRATIERHEWFEVLQLPKRYKWPPNSLLDSLEYNWPLIPGSFVTPQACHESYLEFSQIHRRHYDPVCFRAAVFAAILGTLCMEHNFTYNVNLLSKANREVLLFTKLSYRASRWSRCIEAMCATYFIIGPHHSLINEFGVTRFGVISRALQYQREVQNTIVPDEEIMAPGFVTDYGPSSQRPFRHVRGHHRGRAWLLLRDVKELSRELCRANFWAIVWIEAFWAKLLDK